MTMPESTSTGICLPRANESPVSIGSFRSDFSARNVGTLLTNQGGSYATGADATGTVWLFVSSWQDDGATLLPLAAYGFTMH
ncbi:MAG: hypothetical protein WBB07_24110 [Mycobacterium sp.]